MDDHREILYDGYIRNQPEDDRLRRPHDPPLIPKLQQRLFPSTQNPTMTTVKLCSRSNTDLDAISTFDNNNAATFPLVAEEQQKQQQYFAINGGIETSVMVSKIRSVFQSSSLLVSALRRSSPTCTTSTSSSSTTTTTTSSTKTYSFNRESGLRHLIAATTTTTKTATSDQQVHDGGPRKTNTTSSTISATLEETTKSSNCTSTATTFKRTSEEREASSPTLLADKISTTAVADITSSTGKAKQGGYSYSGCNKALQQQQQVIMGNSFCSNCNNSNTNQYHQNNAITYLESDGHNKIVVTESKKSFTSYLPFFKGPSSLQDTVKHFLGSNQDEKQQQHQQYEHHHIKHLLFGCTTVEQHMDKINEILSATKSQHGSIGLKYAGFEYRCTNTSKTKLFHVETNTCITEKNRHHYIADGCMYEEITKLAQETAQEFMIREGNLQWIDICDKDKPTIRALVSPSCCNTFSSSLDEGYTEHQPCQSKTLLITTGKGKVRAGIFSRKHLIITGLEASTALPHIREAKKRRMRVVVLDPNARGDRLGMDTFERSMKRIFQCRSSFCSYNNKVYVLAHSQAGAQLVRFLLDDHNKNQTEQLQIKAIAFTDSTHNIQWTKANSSLSQLLSGRTSIYLKSTPATATVNNSYYNKYNANNNYNKIIEETDVGKTLDTDHYWKHRFGDIRTLSAGTSVHELVNWTGIKCIWEHFDEHLIG